MSKDRDLFCNIYESEEIDLFSIKVAEAFQQAVLAAHELDDFERNMEYVYCSGLRRQTLNHQKLIDKETAYKKRAEILYEKLQFFRYNGYLPN